MYFLIMCYSKTICIHVLHKFEPFFSDVMENRSVTLKSILACLVIPVQIHTSMWKCIMPVPPILEDWRVGPPPKNYHPGFCKALQVCYGHIHKYIASISQRVKSLQKCVTLFASKVKIKGFNFFSIMSSVNTSSLPKEEKIANKPLILVFEVIMPSLFLLHYFYIFALCSKKDMHTFQIK